MEYNGGNSPSSGLVAILLGLRICNKLNVYGFSLRNCIGRCPKYHYFRRNEVPDRVRTMSFVGHQYDAEGMIIKALHVLGLLCVVPQPPDIGKCGSHFNGLVDSNGGINRLLSKEGVDELLRDPRKSVGLSTVAEDGAARRVTVRRPATRQRRGATSGQYRSRIM
uniref:Uncharacterized protein n=1 Tax=Tetraselmis chuii TaxID=63592 RepID=A0A7S1X5M5_9CHLO